MWSISIKGIIVGHLFSMAASFLVGIALIIAYAAPHEIENFERLAEILNSGSALAVNLVLSALIGIGAGYVAARVAGKGELINGALSSLGYVAAGLYSIATAPAERLPIYDTVDIATAPLLGLLGGYLCLRQRRRVQLT
jgi:hypothetical protein